MVATYHMNPNNAHFKTDKANYKFLPLDRRYVTRATSSDFVINKVEKAAANMIRVHARVNNANNVIRNLSATNDVLTVVALQYTQGDSTVTSDYAAVKRNAYNNFVLNYNRGAQGHAAGGSHLYATAAAAIAAAPQATLVWNNDKGVDLRQIVNTHLSVNGATEGQWDANADYSDHTAKNHGFKYSFELVGYMASEQGVNTRQSVHAAIDPANGYMMRAQMPSYASSSNYSQGVQQAYGYDSEKPNNLQNRATVGRMPLVRVILRDTINNEIASVGYLKFEITNTAQPTVDPEAEHYDVQPVTTAYTLQCENNNDVASKNVAWIELEREIIAKIAVLNAEGERVYGISRNDFEANYDLKLGAGSTNEAAQFASATLGATELSAADRIGSVITTTETENDGTLTQKLSWTVKNQQAYDKLTAGATELVTYICYQKKANPTLAGLIYDKFFVKFTWTPSAINLNPTAQMPANETPGAKNLMSWYDTNSKSAGSGWEEIHGNVETVGTTTAGALVDLAAALNTVAADDEFKFDIKSTLYGYQKKVTLDEPYNTTSLNNNLVANFYFKNGHGLYVNATGDKLYSTQAAANTNDATKLVAQIDPATGVVTYGNGTGAGSTAIAKELLNNVGGHTDLSTTVTARVGMRAWVCGNAGQIARKEVPIASTTPQRRGEFDIKFLCPVTIQDPGQNDVTDAITGGENTQMKLRFLDWRNHDFTSAADAAKRGGHNYFQYYKVTAITCDMANATTNFTGSWKKISEAIPAKQFTYIPPVLAGGFIQANNYGAIHYENDGTNHGDYKVRFPLIVTYEWGTIRPTVEFTVKNTTGQARQK
jgi:hypothetical protein